VRATARSAAAARRAGFPLRFVRYGPCFPVEDCMIDAPTRALTDDADTPTAFQAYGFAWNVLWTYFVDLVPIALAWVALAIPAAVLHRSHRGILGGLYNVFVMVPLNFGALYVYLRAVRAGRPRIADLFEPFRSAYGQTILAHVFFVVLVGMGLVFLIVPGIIVAVRLSFVGYLVVDEHLDAMSAIRESWSRTAGHGGTIFLVWLLGIPISIGGLALLGVGIFPAVMWIHLAFATLFAAVTASERRP
jgi:hypothetical protein